MTKGALKEAPVTQISSLNSHCQLSFLQETKYNEVLEALCNKKVEWKWRGPANKRYVILFSCGSLIQRNISYLALPLNFTDILRKQTWSLSHLLYNS